MESLDESRRRLELTLWAYVIMPDHFHVLFFPERHEYDMGVILKAIKQPVGQRAIAWLRRNAPDHLQRLSVRTAEGSEHRFFQAGGGYDRNLFSAEAMWKSVNYLHLNPVRAGLVARPTDWEWSSARWYAGDRNVPLLMDGTPPAPGVVTPGGTGRRR